MRSQGPSGHIQSLCPVSQPVACPPSLNFQVRRYQPRIVKANEVDTGNYLRRMGNLPAEGKKYAQQF